MTGKRPPTDPEALAAFLAAARAALTAAFWADATDESLRRNGAEAREGKTADGWSVLVVAFKLSDGVGYDGTVTKDGVVVRMPRDLAEAAWTAATDSRRRRRKRLRILPRGAVRADPRVRVVGADAVGFTIVEADLDPDEGVCWRCGGIALDPDEKLWACPHCGGAFND